MPVDYYTVQTLCAFGCSVDVANSEGMQPLHLAAKHGNTEVARCLCLAGASIDAKNREGAAPESCARLQGHTELGRTDHQDSFVLSCVVSGDLLQMLKREGGTDEYIEQLIPTTNPITKIKVKFFGPSGAGKTTLIESLKAGYFSSLFRRSGRGSGSSKGKPHHAPAVPSLHYCLLSTIHSNHFSHYFCSDLQLYLM